MAGFQPPDDTHPASSAAIFAELRQRVALATGCNRTYARLGQLLGVRKTTLADWCTHASHPAVPTVLALLERLPEAEQVAFLRRHCRPCPTVEHAALAWEPEQVDLLRGILEQHTGLTVIAAASPFAVSFVLHALGHSYPAADAHHRAATGLFLGSPRAFVPVEGVCYRALEPGWPVLQAEFKALWQWLQTAETSLVLCDGVWDALPELHPELLRLSRSRHVIVGTGLRSRTGRAARHQARRLVVEGSPAQHLRLKLRPRRP